MEIECPSHAIAIWTEGDTIQVRFPDRQLVAIPVTEWPRLFTILKHREDSVTKRRPMTVGTLAAPVQYDIDAIANRSCMARRSIQRSRCFQGRRQP
jgi:hypothetical protein